MMAIDDGGDERLLGYSEPMLTPAVAAMRLVLAASKPARTRMRAVASSSASTVARDLACEAGFLGVVGGLRAIAGRFRMRVAECERSLILLAVQNASAT
jgi:hypothetical protein